MRTLAILLFAALSAVQASDLPWTSKPLEFQFPGGTVAQWADAFRKASGQDLYVQVAPQVKDWKVPAIKGGFLVPDLLTHVERGVGRNLGIAFFRAGDTTFLHITLETLPLLSKPLQIDFLGGTLEDFARYVRDLSGGGFEYAFAPYSAKAPIQPIKGEMDVYHALQRVSSVSHVNGGLSFFILGRHIGVFSVFPLRKALENTSPEDILSAVNTALKMHRVQQSDRPATVRLHLETKLLFFEGTEAEVNMVRHLVDQLSLEPPKR